MSERRVLEIVTRVADAMDRCGIEYFVGGSIASSIQGHQRLTNDIDVVARLSVPAVDQLKVALGADFDVDEVALKDAIAHHKSWNIFFIPMAFRVDLFPVGNEPFDADEMRRRTRVEILPGKAVFLKSPEDTVLRKLLWFKAAGGQSSQQLRDAAEVLRLQGTRLDSQYLDDWAKKLGLTELLARARADVASSP